MRRSKSDPAKYARNYRKISQRRMTQYDHIDEEKEIERLRSILRDSEAHLKRALPQEPDDGLGKQQSKRRRSQEASSNVIAGSEGLDSSILSGELLAEASVNAIENPLVLPSKKKKKVKQSRVELSPEEIREAKLLQKNTTRKLQQLESRAAQKKQRAELYKKLEQHRISSTTLELLNSSGTISRKDVDTKKQALQKLIKKERAGIELTPQEKDLLYPQREINEEDLDGDQVKLQEIPNSSISEKNKPEKKKSQQTKFHPGNIAGVPTENSAHKREVDADSVQDEGTDSSSSDEEDNGKDKSGQVTIDETKKVGEKFATGIDFAAQMMASLSRLKEVSEKKATQMALDGDKDSDFTKMKTPATRYIPPEPTQLKTAATLGLKSHKMGASRKVFPIKRPETVEKVRYDLPVSAMEFEIMDAIRNNDVTIICGETGSGKSTQVPQYVYESGMCLNEATSQNSFLVGITQPRRVAAVSTAKRVCFEMGCGDGQTIKSTGSKGNMVSYRTRYETAGVGSDTRVQFMTDGILLQEIQSDLLLRRYSVIILDESHERNLNTDVLIGLLSVAIPLRKKAAEEDPNIVPLKLVLMSATLRVEDFTKNEKLFQTAVPVVVTVPGRTHPVTIHHSKVTELDNYESAAYKKICKIHRKLPPGGILVFLTGKAEIIRMVKKLRKALNCTPEEQRAFENIVDVTDKGDQEQVGGPRELDDEELDAEGNETDDFEDVGESDVELEPKDIDDEDQEDNIPKKACILPLYSLLSAEDQAKVFAPIPEGHRLIVVATNIAETSITIPGISYVVDTGRQKCRNYNSGTGVASYDVMWISRAAADQRAGRAGRTGPGHCYRLYSSSLYARHMDAFALPEVLTRPLEDVVLAMKALKVSDVSNFPFPTPPSRSQIDAAVKLLANIGCVDVSNIEVEGGDGVATRLGHAVAKLPLGVRYAKMLLVAAQAGVLDYAIVVVSVLSENSPFQHTAQNDSVNTQERSQSDDESMDEDDRERAHEKERLEKKQRKRWHHRYGDVLAAMLAVGAYTFAGKGAGGASERLAGRRFCEENGLNHVIMDRIQKMRKHLATLAKNRLSTAEGVAARTGGFSSKMAPPNKLQERLLIQAITSGLLDNVALLAPPGSITTVHPYGVRTAYLSSSTSSKEPLYIDRGSTMFTRDFRQLPKWICFDSLLRKTLKDGTTVMVMKNITPVDPAWLGEVAKGTKLLTLGSPLVSPPPVYDVNEDTVLCSVSTKFGSHKWEISPVKQVMYDYLRTQEVRRTSEFLPDDSFRWFARFLLEGKVFSDLRNLNDLLNDRPEIITKKAPTNKASMLVSALTVAGIDSGSALQKYWSEKDEKFLFKTLKRWVKQDKQAEAKEHWIRMVKENVNAYRARVSIGASMERP